MLPFHPAPAFHRQLSGIQYSGIPIVNGATVVNHRVVITIRDDAATVVSDSRLKADQDGTISIRIPRFAQGRLPQRAHLSNTDNAADGPGGKVETEELVPTVTIDQQQIPLRVPLLQRDSTSNGGVTSADAFGNAVLTKGNHTLHVEYHVSAARTGLGQTQRTFAYSVGNGGPLETLEFVYHYDQDTVFNIPELEPAWNWQTGKTGTYLRLDKFKPNKEVAFLTYYSAKVQD